MHPFAVALNRDRSRIHPPAVAHPVAQPSDLGLRSRHIGRKAPRTDRGNNSKLRAAGPLSWGHISRGPNRHPWGTDVPAGLGATPRPSGQAVWPWWVRHWAVERLATAAPKSTDTRGFFGYPREGRGTSASRGGQRKGCACEWLAGGDGGIGRMDRTQGGTGPGGRMSRWGGGHMSRQGASTVVGRRSQVFIKMRTYVPMGEGRMSPICDERPGFGGRLSQRADAS